MTVTPVGMILSFKRFKVLRVRLLLAPVLEPAVMVEVVVEMVQSQAPDCQG